jgi:hypothetical protein
MRTLWRGIVRTIFWSFERGTLPYDIAVALIVMFVLLSPRSWFHDRPPLGPSVDSSMVQLQTADPAAHLATYRVDARLLDSTIRMPVSELEHDLHEAVRKNVEDLHTSNFRIMRIEPVRNGDGTVEYYDVSIKP